MAGHAEGTKATVPSTVRPQTQTIYIFIFYPYLCFFSLSTSCLDMNPKFFGLPPRCVDNVDVWRSPSPSLVNRVCFISVTIIGVPAAPCHPSEVRRNDTLPHTRYDCADNCVLMPQRGLFQVTLVSLPCSTSGGGTVSMCFHYSGIYTAVQHRTQRGGQRGLTAAVVLMPLSDIMSKHVDGRGPCRAQFQP